MKPTKVQIHVKIYFSSIIPLCSPFSCPTLPERKGTKYRYSKCKLHVFPAIFMFPTFFSYSLFSHISFFHFLFFVLQESGTKWKVCHLHWNLGIFNSILISYTLISMYGRSGAWTHTHHTFDCCGDFVSSAWA